METALLQPPPPSLPAAMRSRAGRLGAAVQSIPNSLPPFWITCALTLIVSHYQLWGRLNIAYKILGTVVVVMMPFTAGFFRMLSRPAIVWLLVFEAVMVVNMLLGRYFSISSLFSTASAPIILIRSLPFMLCGYTLASHPRWERRFLLFVATVYWIFAIQDARGFIAGARSGLGRAETYAQTQGFEDTRVGGVYAGAFVYFAPLMLFFAIGLFRLYPSLTKPWRLFVMAIQATFTTVAILAGFGATTAMGFMAVVLLAIYAPVKTISWRLYYLAVSGGIFGIFELIRRVLLAQGGRGAAGDAFTKVTILFQSLGSMFQGVDRGTLEKASSSRVSLLLDSLATFFRNPLFGHGFFGKEDLAVGGHSFLADTAAIFGLVGFVPIALFFWLEYRGLRRGRRLGGQVWPNASSSILLLTLMAGLVMNPYFLNLLSLSYFLFLLLGFALADGDRSVVPAGRSPSRQPGPCLSNPEGVSWNR